MVKQLAFRFGDGPLAKVVMPQFEPAKPPDPFDPIAAYRQRIQRAQTLDVTYPQGRFLDDYYGEIEPHLPCDRCRFPLQPYLHWVYAGNGRFLCLGCFEDEMGLERFTAWVWLDEHAGETGWRRESVEKYVEL